MKELATQNQDKPLASSTQENRLSVKQEESMHAPSLADLDKRLAAHQEAHSLWTELMESAELQEKADQVVMKCENWWKNNSQYLTPEVQEVFRSAYRATRRHPDLLAQESRNWEAIEDNFETIRKAGDIIFKAVFRPGLSQEPHGQS